MSCAAPSAARTTTAERAILPSRGWSTAGTANASTNAANANTYRATAGSGVATVAATTSATTTERSRAARITATGNAASNRMPRPPMRISKTGCGGQITDHESTTWTARLPWVRGAAAQDASNSDIGKQPGR